MKLFQIRKSNKKKPRYTAWFIGSEQKKVLVDFGKKGKTHYIDHKNKKKRDLYYQKNVEKLRSYDVFSKEYLEWFVLNDSVDLKKNIETYKRMLIKLRAKKEFPLARDKLLEKGLRRYQRDFRKLGIPNRIIFNKGKQLQ